MDAFGVRGWGVGLCVFFFRVSCSCHCPMQALRVQNYSWWGFKLYLIRIPKYAKKNNLQIYAKATKKNMKLHELVFFARKKGTISTFKRIMGPGQLVRQ